MGIIEEGSLLERTGRKVLRRNICNEDSNERERKGPFHWPSLRIARLGREGKACNFRRKGGLIFIILLKCESNDKGTRNIRS